jgi:hypothetical protein
MKKRALGLCHLPPPHTHHSLEANSRVRPTTDCHSLERQLNYSPDRATFVQKPPPPPLAFNCSFGRCPRERNRLENASAESRVGFLASPFAPRPVRFRKSVSPFSLLAKLNYIPCPPRPLHTYKVFLPPAALLTKH